MDGFYICTYAHVYVSITHIFYMIVLNNFLIKLPICYLLTTHVLSMIKKITYLHELWFLEMMSVKREAVIMVLGIGICSY